METYTKRVLPVIYLAGAIRDGRQEDIQWREDVILALHGQAVFLNPLGGKWFDPAVKKWYVADGRLPSARFIVRHDFWAVDRADIVLVNFTSLSEGYPSLGSLVEFGRATGTGALLYTILDSQYTGHENQTMYTLHPFLAENSAEVFDSVGSAIAFLQRHLPVLSGEEPQYVGD